MAVDKDANVLALSRRALWVLGLLCFVYAALIATHRGEFWPFSTFSMFSRAGRPWQRALVRVMDEAALSAKFAPSYPLEDLPGTPLPLAPLGISQNDLSGLLQRAEAWGNLEREALASLFDTGSCRAPLLVLRVTGSSENGDLRQLAVPLAAIACVGGHPMVEQLEFPGVPRGK